MQSSVALLRGINVGQAKRVPMATLREVFERAGCLDVVTLRNSGNMVFTAAEDPDPGALRASIAAATGVPCELMVVRGDRFCAIAAANPLRADGRPGNRLAVSFPGEPLDPSTGVPDAGVLAPEEIVVTEDAVYQWLPDGVLQTKVPASWWRALGTPVTARNDATVQRIVAQLDARRQR